MKAAKEKRHNEFQLKKIEDRAADTTGEQEANGWDSSSLTEAITAHPLPAVAIGIGAGFVVGALLRRLS